MTAHRCSQEHGATATILDWLNGAEGGSMPLPIADAQADRAGCLRCASGFGHERPGGAYLVKGLLQTGSSLKSEGL